MDHAKKKHFKRYIGWASLAVLVLLLAVMPLMAKQEAEADGPVASILSATVQTGEVSSALHGGGTLTADGAEDVTIPTGVKITEFLVKNGDIVTKGAPLAVVDKVSVMTAITQVTETMEYLQDEMESARDDTVSSTVRATAGGRVKKIFAQAGESVQDVMLRDGALAVLSLDGLMAVKIERSLEIRTGETVLVTLADGTEVSGRVESNLDGIVVITVEDEGYEIGQIVTAATEDGDRLGAGRLYIHNAWKATAFTGTISTVNAKEESTVSSGASLFTLTDTDYEGELQHRANQHREYEALLQELFQMYESGTINAPCDGSVSGVDKDSAHLLSALEGDWEVELLDAQSETRQGSWKVVLLSNVTPACTKDQNCLLPADSLQHEEGCIMACDRSGTCDATVHHKDCIKSCTQADSADKCSATVHYSNCIRSCVNGKKEGVCTASKHYLTCIQSCTSSSGTTDCPATGSHKATCIESCVHADITGVCESKVHYGDCIEICAESGSVDTPCSASKHKAGCYFADMVYSAIAAKVDAVGSSQLVVFYDASATAYTVKPGASGWEIVGGQLNEELLIADGSPVSVSDAKKFKENDIILIVTGYKGNTAVWSDVVVYKRSANTGGSSSGSAGGMGGSSGQGSLASMIGGLSGFGNYSGTTTQETENLFDLEGSVLMTVTPVDTMTLAITLDEQDIAKVSVGQTATVKVEALRGQSFDAQVSKVGITGTNNGGSSKFTVELTLKAEENMLSGMSATAFIPLEVKRDVLTIPAAALVEDGAKTLVYTALNKETGEPVSPVEVKTGISDGENVEVLSGLSEGGTIYYSYYDTLEMDTSARADKYSFG